MAVVAVINSNGDTVEMLRLALQEAGFESVTADIDEVKRGLMDFPRFLEEHDARAVIYDLPPPYDQNWTFFKLLRTTDALRDRAIILTTTHKGNLEKLVGPTDAIEIIGKPYDLDEVIRPCDSGSGGDDAVIATSSSGRGSTGCASQTRTPSPRRRSSWRSTCSTTTAAT